jgi:two-component system sensor histidine kinase HydH
VLQTPAADVIGSPAKQALPAALWTQVEASERPNTAVPEKEIDCTTRAGRVIPLEIGGGRLTDADGHDLGSILLFKDLSEVRTLRSEVSRNQRLATVGRLAAGVAHEIRNPLSSIKGFATYFRERYRENDQDAQTATILIQEVDRLNRVVGQLLEFSRPVSILPRPIRPDRLIADVAKLVEPQAQAKNIAIAVRHPADMPEVQLDADRLNQVLLNLFLNAIEAMDGGGVLTVQAAETSNASRLEIRVSDTGTGIRSEDLAHIFEPYFTTKPSGTGLGLAIAHNIIEAMGGEINVQSAPDTGTTFTLKLPAHSQR